jgi:choline dehydrogenase-like flavoprotein
MAFVGEVNSEEEFDVCVVGAGPVGLCVALECEERGLSVLLVEGGDLKPNRRTQRSDAIILDPSRHYPLEATMSSGFGGTSWLWGGRCVPFDDIDFERRTYVPFSGWPIGHDDVKPWYEAAARYLDCGTPEFVSPAPGWEQLEGVTLRYLERWARQPKLGVLYRDRIERSRRLGLHLGGVVVGLDLDAWGEHVLALAVTNKAGRQTVRARSYVLACGGLETTRLLLATQREWPRHFGGPGGALGRFYMGHMTGKIASIILASPQDIGNLDFELDSTLTYTRRRFAISPKTQRSNELLNTVFWADNPPMNDPRHCSGALSLAYLALRTPLVGQWLAAEGARRSHVGTGAFRFADHLRNTLKNSIGTAETVGSLLRHRYVGRRRPGFVVRNGSGRYALQYHAEHNPQAESRVRLTDHVDAGGRPGLSIDLRFSQEDAQSILRAHRVLGESLRRSAKGHLEHWYPPEEQADRVLAQAGDGFHQVGTTRMNASPRLGVVDSDCRVHGVSNLFIASSSVFPTTGHANPTFLAGALALRLAAELARATVH